MQSNNEVKMKKLIYVPLVLALIGCSSESSNTEADAEQIPVVEEVTVEMAKYGADSEADNAIAASNVLAELNKVEGVDSVKTKLVGVIEKVCQVKGCWMTMKVNDEQSMHVSFKDYGFFVPKDIDGKQCVIDGYAYMESMSVEELKHYAEDEGKSPEEIEMITEPKTSLSFVADSL